MRWLALKKLDGAIDQYAIGYVTYTVAKVIVDGTPQFEAYRLAYNGREFLGTADTAAGAKLIVERCSRKEES